MRGKVLLQLPFPYDSITHVHAMGKCCVKWFVLGVIGILFKQVCKAIVVVWVIDLFADRKFLFTQLLDIFLVA